MHETTTKRPGRAGKYIRRALLALAAVILAAVLVLLALFQAELRTLNTIERVDDTDLFTMTYLGDYGLDDFLAQGGASNDNELLDFLMQKLLKGLPLRFHIPDLGCSHLCRRDPGGRRHLRPQLRHVLLPRPLCPHRPGGRLPLHLHGQPVLHRLWGGQAARPPANRRPPCRPPYPPLN